MAEGMLNFIFGWVPRLRDFAAVSRTIRYALVGIMRHVDSFIIVIVLGIKAVLLGALGIFRRLRVDEEINNIRYYLGSAM